MPPGPHSRSSLRILCFGDSLTSGYCSWGTVHHAYSETLEALVASALPDRHVETREDGEDGDFVSTSLRGGFSSRIQKHFGPGKPTFDWTIVLGGSNDLAMQVDPDRIFQSLKDVYAVPLSHGSKVLALTVPEARVNDPSLRERAAARRNKLNDLIKGYAKETPNVHVWDLNAFVPYYAMTPRDRERYWDDGLHLTADGYDLMGQKVGVVLLGILAEERSGRAVGDRTARPDAQTLTNGELNPTPLNGTKDGGAGGGTERKDIAGETKREQAPSPKKRRAKVFQDDEREFEEESGSPGELERGYIVVRKKDLY